MSLLDLGAQEPQQEQPQGLAGILGAAPVENETGMTAAQFSVMTPAERAMYYQQSGITGSMAKVLEDSISLQQQDNDLLADTVELKGVFNEMGIDPFGENVEVSSRADTSAASGPIQSILMGTTNPEPWYPQIGMRVLAGDDGTRAIAARRRLIAKDYEKGYDSLRGGGQITEYEGKTIAAAISNLSDASLTDEVFAEHATNLYKKLDRITKLAEKNIEVNPQTGAEFERNRETGETRRAVSFYNKNTGELDVRYPTSTEDVIELPDYLDNEQLTIFKASMPIGQKFSFVDNNGNTVTLRKNREFNLPDLPDNTENSSNSEE